MTEIKKEEILALKTAHAIMENYCSACDSCLKCLFYTDNDQCVCTGLTKTLGYLDEIKEI